MSDCFNFYDVNLIDQCSMVASTENAQFPLSNLKDYRRSKVYRSTSNSANIVLDFQETSEINGIFILANKRDGFGVSTVTIEFNNVDSWVAPPHSVSVSLSPVLDIGHASFPTVNYRFARIVMTSTLSYCELSKVFIGKSVPMTTSISFGWTVKDEELSIKSKNRYGQQFTDVIQRQKVFGFALKNIKKEDLELVNQMLDRCGETKPIYITIGNNQMIADYRRVSGAVILDDVPTITNSNFNRYNLSFSARELV